MDGLTGMHRADAVIVGGTLTGLLLGSSLAQAGLRILLLGEDDGLHSPLTAVGTTLCTQRLQRIEDAWGTDAARLYASALQSQLTDMLTASPSYVREASAYLYARTADSLEMLEKQHELLTRLQLPVSIAPDAGSCPFPVELSLTVRGQVLVELSIWKAALQKAILRHDNSIFTQSRVIAIESNRVYTAQGCAEAPVIVFASGIPPGLRDLRLMALLERRMRIHCELKSPFPLHSIQLPVQSDELSLWPSASGAITAWDAGRCGSQGQQERIRQFELALSRRMPDWQRSTPLPIYASHAADGLPLIGHLPGTRHLCAAGHSGHDILSAMHAAAVLSRRILGQALPEDRLFAPDRAAPRRILRPQIRELAGIYAKNLPRRRSPACTHCSCHMRYSTLAQRWECPLCGSIYDMLGQVVCGPTLRSAALSVRQRPDI